MSDRQTVVDALRADLVAAHYAIPGKWHGRWLRSRRCPMSDHDTAAFGLSRDGKWTCFVCDDGGDLLALIAAAERLDVVRDFPRVLEIAAEIAGVDPDDFGGIIPPVRPPIPELPPIAQRLALARTRASWLWKRLHPPDKVADIYLAERGFDADQICRLETLASTPIRITPEECASSDDAAKLGRMWSQVGVCVPVRSVVDGDLVDVRCRRVRPRENQPKIIGMIGGVTRDRDTLIGCYGRPHELGQNLPRDARKLVVVVEGWADYLTGLVRWDEEADVLGAVDAGSYPLVAEFAARHAAKVGGSVLLVAQWDGDDGAAATAVDEGARRAIRELGPTRVSYLECKPSKDLNELHFAARCPGCIGGCGQCQRKP